MTAWINIVLFSTAITAHEQVAEVIDAPKILSEQLDQTANWVSTYMITSDGLTTGHIPLPPSNGLFYLGFHPWWLAVCVCVVPFKQVFVYVSI